MDPRSTNRQRNSTGNSKGVHRRGEGLGGGPVGRQDGYVGRKTGTTGSRAAKVGGGSGTLVIIIIILFMIFGKGGGTGTGNTGTTNPGATQGTNSTSGGNSSGGSINVGGNSSTGTTSNSGASAAQSFGDISSLFGGFSGAATSTGWQNGLNNTSKLNTEVSSQAREKRTQILGNGQDTVTIMIYDCNIISVIRPYNTGIRAETL